MLADAAPVLSIHADRVGLIHQEVARLEWAPSVRQACDELSTTARSCGVSRLRGAAIMAS